MPTFKDLSRISLREDQVLELNFPPLPAPPPALLRIEGVSDWWREMHLCDERRTQAMYRLVNNLKIARASGSE